MKSIGQTGGLSHEGRRHDDPESTYLEPETKLTAEEPVTDHGASNQHECLMGARMLFLAHFQFSKLVQPGQRSFDIPARLAQAAAVGRATLGQDRLYPLFLIALRWGSES